jgi:hypothetical protein
MHISRRTMLKLLIGSALVSQTPHQLLAAPGTPSSALGILRRKIERAVGNLEIGVDLRQVDPNTGESFFHIQVNEARLYPVASCFKTWLALYYFWNTPRAEWRFDEESDVYSVVVYSNNARTGSLIYRTGERINVFGNAIEKFNDFLLFQVGLQNGLYRWSWEENPVEELKDVRFYPSLADRYTSVHGIRYEMDNLFTVTDLADGYAYLLNNQFDHTYGEPIRTTLNLCSIEIPAYPSPIERSFGRSYTGKDGVLPAEPDGLGRVLNDAGIIQIGQSTYILSFLCAGEGEYTGLEVLRQIAVALEEYEENLWD